MTCPAVGTQSEAFRTLAVVAADGVAADAIAAACSCVVTLVDVWESKEKKGEEDEFHSDDWSGLPLNFDLTSFYRFCR